MVRSVGRLTLAGALIMLGAAFMLDNLLDWRLAWWLTRLWPLLLVGFGLEWVLVARSSDSGQRLQPDRSAVALLMLMGVLSAIWAENSLNRIAVRPDRVVKLPPVPRMEFQYTGPRVPVPPPTLIPFGNATAEIIRTFREPVPGLKLLDVADTTAMIEVVQGDQLQVELTVTGYGATEGAATANAERVRLRVEPGATTRVRVEGKEELSRYQLALRIQVPDGVTVRAESRSGSVAVSGISGAAILESSSGALTARDIRGDVTAIASSGVIQMAEITGLVRATASSGAIRVERALGPLSLQTTSGPIQVAAEQVQGDYDLTASSGSITVTVPAAAGVTVDARTSSGSVTGPAWLTIGEGRGSGSGTQGDGRHFLQMRTSSGAIRLELR